MGKTSTFRTTSNREIPKVPLYYGRFELITVWCGCLSLNKTSVFRTTSDSNKTTPLYCGHTSVERCLMRISLRTTSTLRTHSNWTVESNHNLSITNDFGWSLFNVTLSADFRVKKLKKKKTEFYCSCCYWFLDFVGWRALVALAGDIPIFSGETQDRGRMAVSTSICYFFP